MSQDKDLIKRLKRIQREIKLEREDLFGKPRSKSWNKRPTTKQDRHKAKLNLNKMVKNHKYEEE